MWMRTFDVTVSIIIQFWIEYIHCFRRVASGIREDVSKIKRQRRKESKGKPIETCRERGSSLSFQDACQKPKWHLAESGLTSMKRIILPARGRAKKNGCLLFRVVISIIAGALISASAEPQVEIAQLPPPLATHVDFARDIKPLLENACLKCHGPEQPSGGFRLDVREGALKGGQNGIDIIPGTSADSPLIHFVARLAKGMEMPPKGAGDPLTREQIGLLRAWIDQGVSWPDGITLRDQTEPGIHDRPLDASGHQKNAGSDRPVSLPTGKKVDFVKDIQPIFAKSCYFCHGPERQRASLRLDVRSIALKGSENGPVIVPGDSASSRLIHLVAGLEPGKVMPQSGGRLTAEQVGLLRAWIDQGAHWPNGLDPRPLADRRDHWAFNVPVRPRLPKVKNPKWVRTPIDVFIAAQHEKQGLVPAPEASRRVFIRRLTLDLTGLPPSPQEIAAFLADTSSNAYERLVDRLLASPQYGVRWGRHWLDLARWAETEGYEANELRPAAWRYRDYVIESFNQDKPYDEFLRQQIAGDEMIPYSDENLIATGFLASGRLNNEEEDKPLQRYDMLVDLTNATASVTMGLTLNCAQCHDHKFDPITQRDYYRLQAFFVKGQVNRLLLKDPNLWESYEKSARSEVEVLQSAKQLDSLLFGPVRARLMEEAQKNLSPELAEALAVPPDKRTSEQSELAKKAEKEIEVTNEKLAEALEEGDRKLFRELANKISTLERALQDKKPHAWGFYSPATSPHQVEILPPVGRYPLPYDPEQLKESEARIFDRGDVQQPGLEVEAGWPEVLRFKPEASMGNTSRLALVDWLTSRSHPLLARVWVNYIWQQHFGRGLVETAGDFGLLSSPPTHPQLLDWLATELMERGWSGKQIHRLIVLSNTYRQGGQADSRNAKLDPDNKYWWHWSPRRLEAEAIRDAVLAVSGELDGRLGGPSVSFGSSSAADGGELDPTFAEQNLGSKHEVRKPRRSVYMRQLRDNPPVMQDLFDGPSATESCPRRHVSTVALQPLYMLNNPFILQQAKLFAKRVMKHAGQDSLRQIQTAFALALGRPPEPGDVQDAQAFMNDYTARNEPFRNKGRQAPPSVSRNEPGEIPDNTEAGTGTSTSGNGVELGSTREIDVEPPVGLVHFCHALLNLNEFVYLE